MSDEKPSGERQGSSLIIHLSSLEKGIALFNDQKFWHAHEAWERDWLQASGEEKRFLQGLIQLAAAYHHVQRRTYRGGVRLFDAALRKLEGFADDHLGVNRTEAVARASEHREKIARGEHIDAAEYPKFRYN
jgi:predicted metal-dependent hydrolase